MLIWQNYYQITWRRSGGGLWQALADCGESGPRVGHREVPDLLREDQRPVGLSGAND